MILTIDNIEKHLRSFFGYSESESTIGQISAPRQSPVYTVGAPASAESPLPAFFARDNQETSNDNSDTTESEDYENAIGDTGYMNGPGESGTAADNTFAVVNQTSEDEGGEQDYDNGEEQKSDSQIDGVVIPSTLISNVPTTELFSETAPGLSEDGTSLTGLPTPADGTTWSINHILRSVQYDPYGIQMGFMIDILPNGPTGIPCNFFVPVNETDEPMFASWYVQPCQDSGWFVSWGYNQLTDSAVATLINPDRTEKAWFGWDNINSVLPAIVLPDLGPNAVQACNC